MSFADRFFDEPAGGQYRELVGITTHLAPADLALYRHFLPESLGLPARPTVTIFMVDYIKVVPWPMDRYQEWSVLLLSSYRGRDAWYPVAMRQTSWVPMKRSRDLGFPIHQVDKVDLSKGGDTITGAAMHKGALQLELLFQAGHSRPLAAWETELADNEAFFKGGYHCLVPPGVGLRVLKVDLMHVVPAKWAPQHGMVAVRADPRSSWAGLLPQEGPFPGTYNRFVGGYNMVAKRLA